MSSRPHSALDDGLCTRRRALHVGWTVEALTLSSANSYPFITGLKLSSFPSLASYALLSTDVTDTAIAATTLAIANGTDKRSVTFQWNISSNAVIDIDGDERSFASLLQALSEPAGQEALSSLSTTTSAQTTYLDKWIIVGAAVAAEEAAAIENGSGEAVAMTARGLGCAVRIADVNEYPNEQASSLGGWDTSPR
eukprot:6209766-Pleurochrysis_carterae.AAC.1